MPKTILITGSTDGIGRLTAKMLASKGHRVLLHGRSPSKLETTAAEIEGDTETYLADLSNLAEVDALASQVMERHEQLDVLINNAGVLRTPRPTTSAGLDVRFVVNTIAPYLLTKRLLSVMGPDGRVVNLSSAAQARVDLSVMGGRMDGFGVADAMSAYSQSKLAITAWSAHLARKLPNGPVVVAINPGSLLASKMVKEGFGIAGNDLRIGADILCAAALDGAFADASGKYYDNDAKRFASPNPAALNPDHVAGIMQTMNEVLERLGFPVPEPRATSHEPRA